LFGYGYSGQVYEKWEQFSLSKSRKIPLRPLLKGEKVESPITDPLKALLPLKKGGREGFLGRFFQNYKVLRKMYKPTQMPDDCWKCKNSIKMVEESF